jgi:predicted glycogen debranching enzyme
VSSLLPSSVLEKTGREWLEADGLGGFSSGTVSGLRTRRYHSLLLVSVAPRSKRFVLVNGVDAWVETPEARFALSSQLYTPHVMHPDGASYIESFDIEPWPTWIYKLPNGIRIQHEIFVPHGSAASALSWKILGKGKAQLKVRPFFSGRDYHGLHHQNKDFQFEPLVSEQKLTWQPYSTLPFFSSVTNGAYKHEPSWYKNFLYLEERERGLDSIEDLASPGVFQWDLRAQEAVLVFKAEGLSDVSLPNDKSALGLLIEMRKRERDRRALFPTRFHRSADDFIIKQGREKTIIAGYPWFTDWGRDTFISMRGLCLATGRLDDARDILCGWADYVSDGMVPNHFPDGALRPDYNSMDASLWYVIVVHEYLLKAEKNNFPLLTKDKEKMLQAVRKIIESYSHGTQFNIRMDKDGLLAGGVPGSAITWMDARVDGHVMTPRIGKPVEIQALWINALKIASQWDLSWKDIENEAFHSFQEKFWREDHGYLFDVVDCDFQAGHNDGSFRPNQIFAVGGLPYSLMEGTKAKKIVDHIEKRLWTPLGLRTLATSDSRFQGQYKGDQRERDKAYHQGTVWPWLIGAFVESWLKVNGSTPRNLRQVKQRFLDPIFKHIHESGLGHISEIADGTFPYTPRGCPFQAWSLGEVIRLQEKLGDVSDLASFGRPSEERSSRRKIS